MLQLKIYGLWNLWALYQAVTPVVVIVTTGAKSKVRWRGIKSNKFSVWVDGWVKHRTFMRDEARSWRNFRPASVTSSSCLTLRSIESRKSSRYSQLPIWKCFQCICSEKHGPSLQTGVWNACLQTSHPTPEAGLTVEGRSKLLTHTLKEFWVQINRMKVKTATTRLY